MARKKAQETEVKKTAAEAATKPVPGGAKATKGTAKTASSGKKTAKSGAKSAKSSEKGCSSGAKQTKSTTKGNADIKRKTTKKAAPETAVDKPARTPCRKAADIPHVSGDSAVLDAEARLDAMEEEARTEAAQGAHSASSEPAEIIYSLKAGAQIFVKTADIVAATGKTTSWIRDITARGIIKETKTKHGALYDFTQTMRAYCASLESRRSDDDTADVELKRKKAEAKLKESKAVIAEMQAKEFQGKMHRSEDVQKMTSFAAGLWLLPEDVPLTALRPPSLPRCRRSLSMRFMRSLRTYPNTSMIRKDMTSWCGSGLTVNLTLTSTMEKMKNKSA